MIARCDDERRATALREETQRVTRGDASRLHLHGKQGVVDGERRAILHVHARLPGAAGALPDEILVEKEIADVRAIGNELPDRGLGDAPVGGPVVEPSHQLRLRDDRKIA
jgi:hypothetical protein